MNKDEESRSNEEADSPMQASAHPPVPLPPEVQRLQASQPQIYKAVQQYILQVKSHSGPLPSPESLAAYEEVSPGSALKIIEMAQAEQQIRHHCMKTDVDAIPRGQKFAMCSFVAAMITTCIIAYLGSPGAAAGFGGGAITVFGGAFILARHYGAKEEKAEQPKPSTPKKPKTRSRKG